jgi:hypothetical protein
MYGYSDNNTHCTMAIDTTKALGMATIFFTIMSAITFNLMDISLILYAPHHVTILIIDTCGTRTIPPKTVVPHGHTS